MSTVFMNTYEEGKKYLEQIGVDIGKITKDVGDYIFSVLDYSNSDLNDIKLFAAPQTPPETILSVLGLDINYFEGKKVLDLGGGFGGMPFLLEDMVNQYIVCDPSFMENIKENALNKNIIAQEFFVAGDQEKLSLINKELVDFDFDERNGMYKYNELLDRSNNLSAILDKKQKILDYIDMWKNFNQEKHPKIIINPSKGENIKGVENTSQDIVLICHILDKSYVNYLGIIAEASRILKSDGEILIVEDADDDIRKILKKLGVEREEKGHKVICKIKKIQ
ncbi:class I SAM-dependent methyltransferase [Candidatus Gracilibacteria bacterium]|nr:class I SAM-dependent methyltransferase [Candidatus Gracilibacteria bacterium]